ncbi:Kyphoscoliosis peptidase [Paragonimus skrjabini miyazakii]|uniref:Kyphoscoliosis peptidase n=1 Tax=Paragonimus skrjabini miyazakii TaxID=59628 RepID=A0A8S9Z3C8_9TREM|nr:Kyphoscoliosis peptidase [Paragonimus skrjabini miyazakii]
MYAPAGFELPAPLSSGTHPPPELQKYFKHQVYDRPDVFSKVDEHAIQAVYSHFPEDPRWQLLPVPLTLTQFESLPLTKSQFFKCAIDFLEQHHGVVYTQDGRLRMTLGFWRPGGFTYKLQYLTTSAGHRHPETLPASPSDLSDKVPNLDVDLKGFLLQETTKDKLNYYFRLPAAGVYYLTIYAQELSNLTIGRESTFRAACEYKIVCDAPASDAQTYPTCHDANWGPAWPHVQHYALEPSHSEGVISVTAKRDLTTSTDGPTLPPATVDIHFGKQRPEVSLLAKLHRNGVPDDFLDQYQRVVETARKTQFHVTLPEPGEYGLEIYANEPAEGDTYTHMCQYLIHYEAPAGWRPTTPRLTASGSDAGPSPQAMQSWHPNDSTGDNASYQPGDASKWSASNVQPAGPLKDMYNYELHAPPMGQLPRPYADSQYAEANTSLKFGKSQFPNRYSPSYGRTPSPVNKSNRTSLNYAPRTGLIATGTAQDRFVSPAAPKASMEAISDLTGSLSSVRLRQSSESILVNKNQIHRSRLSDLGKHTDDVPSVSHCSQPKGQLGTTNKDCLLTVQPYMANVARGGSPVLLGRRDAQLQSDNRRVSFDPTLVGHLDESHTSDLPLPSPPPYVRLNSWSSSGGQKSHRDLPPPVVCVCVCCFLFANMLRFCGFPPIFRS